MDAIDCRLDYLMLQRSSKYWWKDVLGLLISVTVSYILTISSSFHQLLQSIYGLRSVFKNLKKNNFELKPTKCEIFKEIICYFGHEFSAEGIHVYPTKTEAVRDWPIPKSITGVRDLPALSSVR